MDKKRREKTSVSARTNDKKAVFKINSIARLTHTQKQCGIISRKFKFLEEYGEGVLEFHQFDGLHIGIFDVSLNKDFIAQGELTKDVLELSFLIEGEQIIRVSHITSDFIYESQESYLVYLSKISGSISYYKRKRLKEVKIRMDLSFVERHQLNSAYDILNVSSISNLPKGFIKPLCYRTQEILTEIITDKRKGLLKRLFLESKVLELITLKLDIQPKTQSEMKIRPDHLVKKLYKTQHVITSDLSVQYSIVELAKQIGLNDFVLKKEFKRVFGKTIFEYATELRMEKARQLLQHSSQPIYEISEAVGYKNATHFTAAFKKIEGITPKKFRNSRK